MEALCVKDAHLVMNVPILPSFHSYVHLVIFPATNLLLPALWYNIIIIYVCMFVVSQFLNCYFLSLYSVLLDILTLEKAKLHAVCVPLGIYVLCLTSYRSFATLVNFHFLDL